MNRLETINARDYSVHPAPDYPDYRSSRLRHPKHNLITLPQTMADICGPVFGHSILGEHDDNLIINYATTGEAAIGERIKVHGFVLDEAARPVTNALIEVWQANASGRYRHKNDSYIAALDPNFGGCGRCITDVKGYYSFMTVRPGPYPWPNGGNDWRPAHIHFSIFGSCFAQRLITQMYFEGDPHIPICPIIQSIQDSKAIDQLTARLDMENTSPMDNRAYRFDLILRGPGSTLFENKLEGN